jgi:putative DNA primase/helicase
MICPDNLPPEIRDTPRWVGWNYETRGHQTTKVPYMPSDPGTKASVADPTTWGSFQEAFAAYEDGKADGIGFVLGEGITGVDLDKCRDPETEVIEPDMRQIITDLDSYTEVSPSGTGVHVLVRGSLPPGRRRKGAVEMYSEGRYFSMTGDHVEGRPTTIQERAEALASVHARIFSTKPAQPDLPVGIAVSEISDTELLQRARSAANGSKFIQLWSGDTSDYHSQSEADLALCSFLAFWARKDASRLDHLFRQSRLMRPKWDENHGEKTYGAITIGKAIEGCRETYSHSRNSGWKPMEHKSEKETEHLTDLGNAHRLCRLHGHMIRYVREWGRWLIWDGRRWARDRTGGIERLAKETVRGMHQEVLPLTDRDRAQELSKHAFSTERESRIKAMISLAKSEPGVSITPEEMDADPWAFNVMNGTIDLKTGTLREHRQDDLITKLAPIEHDATATATRWSAFLDEIMDGRPSLADFIQRAVGYSMTGVTSEHVLLFLHGLGANGKTTLLNTLLEMFGDYGRQSEPELLMKKRSEAHPTGVADLQGARLVTTSEIEAGRRLAESLVKQLTGGDRIKARFMRQDFFEFDPTHTLWLAANHKPVVKGTDIAIWRRIILVPFDLTIPPAQQDRDLGNVLAAELSGVLNWAIKGCLDWQRDGLSPPDEVSAATKGYQADMDTLGGFIAEHCVLANNATVAAKDLYDRYKAWAEESGEHKLAKNVFGQQLKERGFENEKDSKTRRVVYLGIGLNTGSEATRSNVPNDSLKPPHLETNAEVASGSFAPAVVASVLGGSE